MSATTDLLDEINREIEAEKGFGSQFIEGAKQGISLGYLGSETPENLPLSGKIGRIAGNLAGAVPAFEAGATIAGAAGITGLAAELATGGIYGFVRKPEESESRINNAIQDSALFGAGYGVIKGLGKVFGRGTEAAPGAGGVGQNLDISPFRSPKDMEAYKIAQEGLALGGGPKAPPPPPGAGPVGEEMAAFNQAKEMENITRASSMENTMQGYEQPSFETPDSMIKTMEVNGWEQAVKPWARDILDTQTKELEHLDNAGRMASEDLEAAAMQSTKDAGLHNLGETPASDTSEVVNAIPNLETAHALQATIDGIVTKNALPIETIQAATQVKEPINFLMSKGVNFDDAANLVDKMAERVKINPEVAPASKVEFSGKNAARPVPAWEKIKDRSYQPDEIYDLFYNVPIKGPEAIRHGLLEARPPSMDLHLTEKGYAFLKQYNPEGLIGQYPEFISRKALGSIRGQGFSNLSHSEAELKDLGFKMPLKVALEKDFIRPASKGGKEIAGEYQLTEKGAGMLAGGRGANANIPLKQYDMMAGRRLLPENKEGIAEMGAERARNKVLFKDVFEQTKNLSKGCPE